MPEWVALVTQGGVAAVLAAWLWVEQQRAKTEREERLRVQAANDDIRNAYQERVIKALNDATTAIKESRETQESLKLVIEGMKTLLTSEAR